MRASAGQLARRGDVTALVARVTDPRRRNRLAAVTALRRFPGDESEAALLRALDDDSFFIVLVAVQSLAAIDADRDPEPIVRALRQRIARDDNEFLREIAQPDEPTWKEPSATEITELGLWRLMRVNAVEELTAALDGGALAGHEPLVARMRRRSLAALGEIGDPVAGDAAAAALADSDRNVRVAAVEALGKISGAEATPALRRALQEDDGAVRRAALNTLASVGGDEALLALRQACREGRLLDRFVAARALWRAERGEPAGSP